MENVWDFLNKPNQLEEMFQGYQMPLTGIFSEYHAGVKPLHFI